MKQTIKNLVMLVAAALFSVGMNAQVTTATISGLVTDSQGPVAGATVITTNTATGLTYYTMSSADGIFHVLNVRAGGPYRVSVQMLGYTTEEITDVYANIGDNTMIDVVLKEESLALDAVVVSAEGATSNMRSDRAGSITTVNAKQMATLPTTTRSMNDVMSLTPQSTVTSNGFAVGGGNYRQSYVTVDGAAFNNAFGIGSNLPGGGTPISLDALDQMSVSLTPYDVRQSGFVGGAIQTTTKSGTNDLKIAVYDYYHSQALEGTKYGTEGNVLKLVDKLQNTTGISVGGPIVKDRIFFFVNFEYDIDNNPGQTYFARKSDSDKYGSGTQYKRPTEAMMNEISDYLKSKYNYDPGVYQDYSFNTPDWKAMARIDWNINTNNHLTLRYSRTANKYMTSPSSSVSPFGSSALYNRNSYGRTSNYALYFKNANYYQEQNFSSVAAELNSRFWDGKGANILRVTYSHQYEPRSYNGELFPTVDILQNENIDGTDTRAVYTTFGIDPFTYGNLRDVATWQATDEFSYLAGKHNLLAGVSFETNNAKNGYMQMGAGYYLYASWEAFKNDATPLAFAITHGNNDELQQQFPYLINNKFSVYAQDEISFSDKFKLTAGVRFELPTYPSMDFNENKDFTSIFANRTDYTKGWKTSDVPAAYLSVSPRIGFNWDVLGNRKLVLRGGSGIYMGSLPMVWLVSAVGNSNVMQAQTFVSGDQVPSTLKFHTTIPEILKDLYGGSFKQQELTAPGSTTVLDKNLKLPTTWKSSLAVDATLPGGIKASLEGIYNKDLHSVVVTKEGMEATKIQLPGEPQQRSLYSNASWCKNNAGKNINPYWVHNSDKNGYYYSVTAKLEKNFKNISLMAAYTRSNSISLNDGLGDQVTSVFSTNTYAINGSNETDLGYSSFVTPNRVIANVNWTIPEGRHSATTLSAFYEGQNLGFVGTQYSYTRWNYTMSSCITGDGGAYNLIYIPTQSELTGMPFTSDENRAKFEARIQNDKYLSSHRGQYAERGGCVMPWHNALNVKVAQDFYLGNPDKRMHNLQVSVDIKNVLNMINPSWGNIQSLNNQEILTYKNGAYTYNESSCTYSVLASTASTWQMLLSVRYSF